MLLKVLDQVLLASHQLFQVRHLMTLLLSKIKVGVIICVILKAEHLLDCGLVEDTVVAATSDCEAALFEKFILLVQFLKSLFSLLDVELAVVELRRAIR